VVGMGILPFELQQAHYHMVYINTGRFIHWKHKKYIRIIASESYFNTKLRELIYCFYLSSTSCNTDKQMHY